VSSSAMLLAGAAVEDVLVDEGCGSDLTNSNDGEPCLQYKVLYVRFPG